MTYQEALNAAILNAQQMSAAHHFYAVRARDEGKPAVACLHQKMAAKNNAINLALRGVTETKREITSAQKQQNWERLQAVISAGLVHMDAIVEQRWAEREHDLNCPACAGSGHVGDVTSNAAMDVLAERRRQIEVKGWAPEHDDSHNHGELAHAAGVLALADVKLFLRGAIEYWPWDAPSMEADIIGTSYRTRLIKAAALLLAEIERVDRLEKRDGSAVA